MVSTIKRKLRCRRGEGYIDVVITVLCVMLVLALALQVLPAFIYKQQLDNFATELAREAEIAGRVGSETDRRAQVMREKTGLNPDISWSASGRIQLNQEFTVTVTMRWRASRPRTASTRPASTSGDRLRVRVVRSMPSSSASSPSTRGSRSLRRRMEYWLRLRPTGASAWSYTCVTRRLARRRRKQVHWLGVEERAGGVIDIPGEGSEAIMCICT